jgi:transcriptional regulator with XRE-family HTH domain
MASKQHTAHPLLGYVLNRAKITRAAISKKLGIARQTLYDWEYGITPYKPHMLDDILEASGFDPARIPDRRHKEAEDMEERRDKGKPLRDLPPTHKRDVYGENVKAEAERKARQAAKATDPKRHRIPNLGYPTAANKNPSTFSQLGPRSLALIKQEGGRDIPSDAELPDMIAITLEPLRCYEPIFVGHHMIPHVGNRTGTINAGGDIYWKRPDGTRCVRATLDEAKVAIAQQMAQDEAATADLI